MFAVEVITSGERGELTGTNNVTSLRRCLNRGIDQWKNHKRVPGAVGSKIRQQIEHYIWTCYDECPPPILLNTFAPLIDTSRSPLCSA